MWKDIGLDTTHIPSPLIYLDLPIPPKELIEKLPLDSNLYNGKKITGGGYFKRSDDHSKELNDWCKKNINKDLIWDIQILSSDLHPHKDKDLNTKLNLLIQTGNNKNDVYTYFYNENNIIDKFPFEDKIKNPIKLHNLITNYISHKFKIDKMRWHLLSVNKYHSVFGIDKSNTRISLVANIN